VGKVKRLFVCSSCERSSLQWSGRCPFCGEWGTVAEQAAPTGMGRTGGSARPAPVLSLVPDPEERRTPTGLASVDRVLGGGLVPGSVVLLAGAPGIGKSTLLLQLASRLTEAGHPCLLASGEETRAQVARRARRIGLNGEGLRFTGGRDLADVLATAASERPAVLVVDSIQTIRDSESESLPGGPGQVRACADALIGLAKGQGITLILVGHVTKDGDLAGPRTLEHAVDVVLSFEGEPRSGLRILAGGKNRYGPEGEVAWFEMTSGGLAERADGPLIGDGEAEPGCATSLALAGRRAFAVDVQALVVPTEGPAKRQVSGPRSATVPHRGCGGRPGDGSPLGTGGALRRVLGGAAIGGPGHGPRRGGSAGFRERGPDPPSPDRIRRRVVPHRHRTARRRHGGKDLLCSRRGAGDAGDPLQWGPAEARGNP